MSAGKGDRPRPVDGARYRANYERIFRRPYPDWICDECGRLHGKRPEGNPYGATYHFGTCDLCGHSTDVTEPRDWGHLRDSWQTQKHGLQPQKKTPKKP